MRFFENQQVVMDRVSMLLPGILEELLEHDNPEYLSQEFDKLTRVAKNVDKYCSHQLKNGDLQEYSGIVKTIVKNINTVEEAMMLSKENKGFDIPATAAALSLSYSRLYGIRKQIELTE